MPRFNASVRRSTHVVVRGLNENGTSVTLDETGLLARILKYEIGHLNGMLYMNRPTRLQREILIRKIREMIRRTGKW